MTEKFVKIGVAVIVKHQDKILLGKRLNVSGSGSWGLPGGHLEFGETLIECGRRELLEETGLKASSLTFVNITNDFRPEDGQHYIHIVLLTAEISGELENREPEKCEKWEWFSEERLPEPIFYGHKKFLAAVFANKMFSD